MGYILNGDGFADAYGTRGAVDPVPAKNIRPYARPRPDKRKETMDGARRELGGIIGWIKDTVRGNGGVAVLIDGSMPSSVTAALCSMALGKAAVTGVMLPVRSIDGLPDGEAARKAALMYCGRTVAHTTYRIPGLVPGWCTFGVDHDPFDKGDVCSKARFESRCMSALERWAADVEGGAAVIGTATLTDVRLGRTFHGSHLVGDADPLAGLTYTEVGLVGAAANIPEDLLDPMAPDGDLGFPYIRLDRCIRGTPDRDVADIVAPTPDKTHSARSYTPAVFGVGMF